MDTGEGRFELFFSAIDDEDDMIAVLKQKFPKAKGVFRVGEELEIKGSKFRVKEITPFGIKLKLLKQD